MPFLSTMARFRGFSRTTNMGVRDFRAMARPLVGPEWSQVTTTTRIEGVTCGKESTSSTLPSMPLSFIINYLNRGGGRGTLDCLSLESQNRIFLSNG